MNSISTVPDEIYLLNVQKISQVKRALVSFQPYTVMQYALKRNNVPPGLWCYMRVRNTRIASKKKMHAT